MLLFIIFLADQNPDLDQHHNHVGDIEEGQWEEEGCRKTRHAPSTCSCRELTGLDFEGTWGHMLTWIGSKFG